MPNYRRDRDGRTYFFTVVSYRRQPILCDPRIRRILRVKIVELRRHRPFAIDAWVPLPDHLHCIWTMPDSDTDFSTRWAWLKKIATKAAAHCGVINRSGTSLWQARFWEHRIRDEGDFQAHCDYIHWNPVRHGLVSHASDWPWPTFHRFVVEGLLPQDWGKGGVKIVTGIGREWASCRVGCAGRRNVGHSPTCVELDDGSNPSARLIDGRKRRKRLPCRAGRAGR